MNTLPAGFNQETITQERLAAWEQANAPLRSLNAHQVKLVQQEVRPLVQAVVEIDNNPITDVMDNVARTHSDPVIELAVERRTARQTMAGTRLLQLGGRIKNLSTANPDDILEGRVLNPERAEAMARAADPHVTRAKRLFSRREKHLKRADAAAESASQAYMDSLYDPAETYDGLRKENSSKSVYK